MVRVVSGVAAVLLLAGCVPSYQFAGTDDSGAPPEDARAETQAPPGDAASPVDAVSPVDAPDATPAVDGGSLEGIVECHSGGGNVFTACPLGSQGCCGVFANIPDFCVDLADADASCTAADDAATAVIQCDEPDQCPQGSVCCAQNLDLARPIYTGISCVPAADCTSPAGVECGTMQTGPFTAACPGGQHCTAFIDDYYFCN